MGNKTDDGDPAFPVQLGTQHDRYLAAPGMSLRDWFAGQALTGLLMRGASSPKALAESWDEDIGRSVAYMAYEFADAMLEERKRGDE